MANVILRDKNGNTITVSEEAAKAVYLNPAVVPSGRYTMVSGGAGTTTIAPAPSAPTPTGGMVTIQMGNSTNTVPAGDVSYWQSRGWSVPGASSTTPTPSTPTTPTVDQTGWTPAMQQAYQAMTDYVTTLKEQNKVINPEVVIDDATVAKFREQATKELAPYYRQTFAQAEADLKYNIEQVKKSYETTTRDLSRAFGRQLESTQQNFADRGLTFGTEELKAEKGVAEDYNAQLESAARTAEQQARAYGTAGERSLGSAAFPNIDTSLSTASATLGGPGQYGLSFGTGSRSLFTPVGGTTGTISQQQERDVTASTQQLTEAEQARRRQKLYEENYV